MEYNKNNKLRVFCAFAGYDSQCLALERLKQVFPEFDYELVGWSEIDDAAIKAHNALFPEAAENNYGDISKIDWSQVPDFDLFTYSFPCTDVSAAGLQKGFDEGSETRSSLLWECRKTIIAKKPKYLLLENVAALVSKKFIKLFNKWRAELYQYGYENFAQVLNAKNYGVPQNRDRIFLFSIYDPTHTATYHFPEPMKLEKTLTDLLEDNVDKKYYLSYAKVDKFVKENKKKIMAYAHKSNEPILPLPFDLKEMIDNAKEEGVAEVNSDGKLRSICPDLKVLSDAKKDTNDTEQQEA